MSAVAKEFWDRLERHGGTAFPTSGFAVPDGGTFTSMGMTTRAYLAGQAMTAVISLIGIPSDPNEPDDLWNDEIAKQCVGLADAVLKALES